MLVIFGILYLSHFPSPPAALDILLENYSEDPLARFAFPSHGHEYIGFLLRPISLPYPLAFRHPAIFIIVFVGYGGLTFGGSCFFGLTIRVVHHPEMRFPNTREVMQAPLRQHFRRAVCARVFLFHHDHIHGATPSEYRFLGGNRPIFTIMLFPFVLPSVSDRVLADRRLKKKEMPRPSRSSDHHGATIRYSHPSTAAARIIFASRRE